MIDTSKMPFMLMALIFYSIVLAGLITGILDINTPASFVGISGIVAGLAFCIVLLLGCDK